VVDVVGFREVDEEEVAASTSELGFAGRRGWVVPPRVSCFKVFGAGRNSALGFIEGTDVDGGGACLVFRFVSSGNVEYRA
jgi:hypothetical protein